jgi:type II secretory pathway component GspD/PulD (secretin)
MGAAMTTTGPVYDFRSDIVGGLAPSRMYSMHPAILLAVLLIALAGITSVSRAESLETIPLSHRMAEDLLPILQPLLPPGSVLTGTGNVLLVRTDPATLEQLRATVAQLDRAPRQLLISVGQSSGVDAGGTSVRGSGTVGSGDVQVGINQPPQATAGAQAAVRSGSTRDSLRTVASVRALEGFETYISVGQSRPYTSTSVISGGGWRPPTVVQTTGFQDVQSGFFATPRVNGDRVTLVISSQQQRLTGGGRQSQVATASATTTVSGRLGEWIEIGGSSGQSDGRTTGLVTWGTRTESTQYSAWVKVDEVQ